MFKPFIYMSTWKIKEDRLEDYKQFARELIEHIEAKEPQLIAFNMYFNKDETEMTSIQVHPDADSMDFHLQVLAKVVGEDMIEWVDRAGFLESKHIEIYGTPAQSCWKLTSRLWMQEFHAASNLYTLPGSLAPRLAEHPPFSISISTQRRANRFWQLEMINKRRGNPLSPPYRSRPDRF